MSFAAHQSDEATECNICTGEVTEFQRHIPVLHMARQCGRGTGLITCNYYREPESELHSDKVKGIQEDHERAAELNEATRRK